MFNWVIGMGVRPSSDLDFNIISGAIEDGK